MVGPFSLTIIGTSPDSNDIDSLSFMLHLQYGVNQFASQLGVQNFLTPVNSLGIVSLIFSEFAMDELIKKAREQRERAIQQRDELTAIINSLDQFITNYEKALAKAGGASPPEVRQADLFARPVNRAERTRQVAHMMDLAAELIHAAGHPLTRSELLEELEGRGFRIEGGDKSKVLGTNLWRSKRFHNLKGVGYWPKETPLPEAFAHFQLRPSMLTDD